MAETKTRTRGPQLLDKPEFGALPKRQGGPRAGGTRRGKYADMLDLLRENPDQEACIARGEPGMVAGARQSLYKTHSKRGFKFATRGDELWAVYGEWSAADADFDTPDEDEDDDD